MKANQFLTAVSLVLFGPLQGISQDSRLAANLIISGVQVQDQDLKAVKSQVDRFRAVFDQGDAAAVARMFTEDGEMIGPSGSPLRGRANIEAGYQQFFDTRKGATISLEVKELRFLTKEVAREDGVAKVTMPDASEEVSRYSVLYVKQRGEWLQQEVRDYPQVDTQLSQSPVTETEHPIKKLDWMIGDWVDESPEAIVTHSCKYVLNERFILREYSAKYAGEAASEGVHIIGFDPLTLQYKSWGFDAEGSYGHAVWTKSEEGWVIKMNGVLGDGTPVSATQLMTMINKGAIRLSSVERTLGNMAQPDREEVILVRKPPSPEEIQYNPF
jgi:uncharacterized protein (TIGR02246 family)